MPNSGPTMIDAIIDDECVIGCLLGTAVGDAIGLPFEGLSKRRQHRMCRDLTGHRFLFGRGMVSDDTEHTCMVAQALIASAGDAKIFTRSLAWRFRFWLLGLPAGIGKATLQGIVKLWLGFPHHRSGVFSAGNGPAMRSPIIGVCFGHDPEKMRELVRASTRLTHTDPKAEWGALAVALAAHMASAARKTAVQGEGNSAFVSPQEYYKGVEKLLAGQEADELLALLKKAIDSVAAGQATESFAAGLGLERGVSAYTYHTVPVALHAWLTHQDDIRSAIIDVVRCGGDTDSTAAIVGGIAGAGVGREGVPRDWIDGLIEWPRTAGWMERLGTELTEAVTQQRPGRPVRLLTPGLLLRNLFFLIIVLLHGFRRLLPPY